MTSLLEAKSGRRQATGLSCDAHSVRVACGERIGDGAMTQLREQIRGAGEVNTTEVPGLSAWNRLARSVNVSLSDAAANTVIDVGVLV